MLGLRDSVYQKYEDVCNKCRVCSTSIAPPPRARASGIRASNYGGVIFVDHAEIQLRKNKYMVLLVLDGATNLLWGTGAIQALRLWTDENNCLPKAIVGDEAFFKDDFLTYYRTHGIRDCLCGSRTPWPNRAETAVRLFKRQWQLMRLGVGPEYRTQQELQRLALRAHQEARQAADLRHDMARRTMPSDGPYKPCDKVFVWHVEPFANAVNLNEREKWVRGTVISQEGSMVNAHVDNSVLRVNQSKIRRDHDEWHDVAVPGLDNPDPVALALEDEDQYGPSIAGGDFAKAYFGEQTHWFCQTGKCDVVELFSSNTGLSWYMSRMHMEVGEPIDHKHGWSFNSKTKQYQVWNQLERLDPEYVLVINPSPNSGNTRSISFAP